MRLRNLLKFSDQIHQEARDLMAKKNKDYSNDDSVHDNFMVQSLLCSILGVDIGTHMGAIEFLILFKIHRLFKMAQSDGKPANESVKDTVVDLHNYIDLLLTASMEDVL